jgi:dTDP-L-rhamnose 4-epimerase
MRVLVIGGAGFVGSHTVDALVERGYQVRVFDNLDAQVHVDGKWPVHVNTNAEYIAGNVLDVDALRRSLRGVDAVFYLAAAVGVGQSMYEIRHYVETNTLGAANFLELLAKEPHSLRKMIVASSMSIYGEGKYICPSHGAVFPSERPTAQLNVRDWEMRCPTETTSGTCAALLTAVGTPEDKPLSPTSVYAINKRDHEEMFLAIGRAYQIPAVALRYFNIYGPRQALSNPYTGAVAIFASRLLNEHGPVIYEDGLQSRDFIHVSDIVRANLLALERDEANFQVFNVGTGVPTTILTVASTLAAALGVKHAPAVVNRYRVGDIRHCFADINRIRTKLRFEPRVPLADGIADLLGWLKTQSGTRDDVDRAQQELEQRGLIH